MERFLPIEILAVPHCSSLCRAGLPALLGRLTPNSVPTLCTRGSVANFCDIGDSPVFSFATFYLWERTRGDWKTKADVLPREVRGACGGGLDGGRGSPS